MRQNRRMIDSATKVVIAAIVTASLLLSIVTIDRTNAYLKLFVPKSLPVGSTLNMNGTSLPSNHTRTHCEISVNVNNAGYQKATPAGANGSQDFTKWTFSSGPVIKPGPNKVTTRYSCFPSSSTFVPDFVYHHSVNVTGR